MIAYYGGGFDPVHNGHLFAARTAQGLFSLDQVRFILTAWPVHKEFSGRGITARWEMLKLALQNQEHMFADDIEISDTCRKSYTYDTLCKLRTKHGETEPLLWLMGSDQFAVLDSWYRGLELISLAHILVFVRPAPVESEKRTKRMQKFIDLHLGESVHELTSSPSGKLYFVEQAMLDISSTQVREHLKTGTCVQELLPASVLSYIMEKQLYPTGDSE